MKEPLCVCLSAVCLKAAGAQMDFPASFLQATGGRLPSMESMSVH